MQVSNFIYKRNIKNLNHFCIVFKLECYTFLFLENAQVIRQLLALRQEASNILNIKPIRVQIFSGFYIGFVFSNIIEVFKFLNLNYEFNNFFSLILFNQKFLNCSLSQFKELENVKIENHITNLLFFVIWFSILHIFFSIGYILSTFFIE